jgi:hypothetical protein
VSLGHHVSRDPIKTIPELISAARASPGSTTSARPAPAAWAILRRSCSGWKRT